MKDKDKVNARISVRISPCRSYVKFHELKLKTSVKPIVLRHVINQYVFHRENRDGSTNVLKNT